MVTYVDPSANPQGVLMDALLWFMLIMAGIFLGLRIYCKLFRARRLWWDDLFIILSWVALLASCASTTANIRLGFGLHTWTVPQENFLTMGILSNTSGFMSVLALTLSKTSFAVTLLRLSDGWTRWLVWFIIIVLNVTQILAALFFWVYCDPPEKTWNPTIPGKCWPMSVTINYSVVVGTLSAAFDFGLALLPWKILMSFHMYRREKVGVAIAMSMGVFAGITAIMKCTTIHLLESDDFTCEATPVYNLVPLVLWGFAEVACTIMAASIPMLRALFRGDRRTREMPSLHVDITSKKTGVTASSRAHEPGSGGSNNDLERGQKDDRSDRSILATPASSSGTAQTHENESASAIGQSESNNADTITHEMDTLERAKT
ncbi:putative integral membrane protein [Diplogelasinospora grovesii]|uniref:Integral membrane protein n=1 Tax=Diplogelasinospora grovesii TaxID=303347 RepID=A0AAN6N3B3_9PEZI|nr:putative integral membrane protein [Diplogelasinospora grovesii]